MGRHSRSETQVSPVHAPTGCFVRAHFALPSGARAARAQFRPARSSTVARPPEASIDKPARRRLNWKIIQKRGTLLNKIFQGAREKQDRTLRPVWGARAGFTHSRRKALHLLLVAATVVPDFLHAAGRSGATAILNAQAVCCGPPVGRRPGAALRAAKTWPNSLPFVLGTPPPRRCLRALRNSSLYPKTEAGGSLGIAFVPVSPQFGASGVRNELWRVAALRLPGRRTARPCGSQEHGLCFRPKHRPVSASLRLRCRSAAFRAPGDSFCFGSSPKQLNRLLRRGARGISIVARWDFISFCSSQNERNPSSGGRATGEL